MTLNLVIALFQCLQCVATGLAVFTVLPQTLDTSNTLMQYVLSKIEECLIADKVVKLVNFLLACFCKAGFLNAVRQRS